MVAGRSWDGLSVGLASLIVTRWPLAGSPGEQVGARGAPAFGEGGVAQSTTDGADEEQQ